MTVYRLMLWLALSTLLIGTARGVEIGRPIEISKHFRSGGVFMNVRLLGLIEISHEKINDLACRELSGLAWDQDAEILYAVSDSGYLVHLRPQIENGILTGVGFQAAFPLRGRSGQPLPEALADAEGLEILNGRNGAPGDAELIVSFEQPPRVVAFRPEGVFVRDYPLPPRLQDPRVYADENNQLEALALHPAFGLLTIPSRPLAGGDQALSTIYSLDDLVWRFAPLDYRHSAAVALETAADGSLIVVERRYEGFFTPIVFAVRRLSLDSGQPGSAAVEELVQFNPEDGWTVDNYEGIARHEGDRYFLVSDDNQNPIQRTLLLYFEILIAPRRSQANAQAPFATSPGYFSASLGISSARLHGRVR
ncbi:MAG: esterase-like activity of phytase family protein [Gammaproteobacteria bacterium]